MYRPKIIWEIFISPRHFIDPNSGGKLSIEGGSLLILKRVE
jgi:hypothetical protein